MPLSESLAMCFIDKSRCLTSTPVLQNGNWQDRTCDERHGFICMKQSTTESTGEEVYVEIGCKFVSQGCTWRSDLMIWHLDSEHRIKHHK